MKSFLKWIPIYVVYITMLGSAAFEKLSGGGVPAWFDQQFSKSILNAFPGSLAIQFYSIAILEMLVTVGFILSLAVGDYKAGSDRKFLRLSLWGSTMLFAMLSFGLRITHDFATGSQVFINLVASFALLLFLEHEAQSKI